MYHSKFVCKILFQIVCDVRHPKILDSAKQSVLFFKPYAKAIKHYEVRNLFTTYEVPRYFCLAFTICLTQKREVNKTYFLPE